MADSTQAHKPQESEAQQPETSVKQTAAVKPSKAKKPIPWTALLGGLSFGITLGFILALVTMA